MDKSGFRNDCLHRLRTLSSDQKSYRDGKINAFLETILKDYAPKRVLVYWPFGFEADIRKTIFKLRPRASVYLPFMDDISFKMVHFRYPLERKRFGIYEPRNSNKNIKIIDIAIVPVVGVDGAFRRIGFGRGMYDRFFPTLKHKPLIVFVQAKRCTTNTLLCDDYDIRGDMLVTPEGIYCPKDNKNVTRNVKRTYCRRSYRRY